MRIPKKIYWLGNVGPTDDFGRQIATVFWDGKTKIGPWAIMSYASWKQYGCGKTGTGYAQKYEKQEDGQWMKVEG